MLGNLRYYSIFGFFALLVLVIASGLYFRSMAINAIIEKIIKRDNLLLINDLITDNLWEDENSQSVRVIANNLVGWQDSPEFINFAKQVLDKAEKLNFIKLSVYTTNRIKFISTNDEPIEDNSGILSKLFFHDKKDNFLEALKGSPSIDLLTNSEYKSASEYNRGALVAHYIPIFRDPSKQEVIAVVETFSDISVIWNYLYYFQVVATIIVIFIFTVLYSILSYISIKAERIITSQHEQNLELSQAKVRAEEESREKSKFLANVSHELRTPLNSIIGFSEMIKNETLGPIGNKKYGDYINDIHTSGTHLLSLINDILDYSKASAEKLEIHKTDVDITKIIKACVRMIKPRAEEAVVNLVEDVPKEHLVLKTDHKRMKQVLLNLLSNAVKFTPENGTVTIGMRTDHDNKKFSIMVQDTGIGIAQKDISKAMSTFGQVDSKLSRKYEGTGLGLPLTKKLVELMNGKFRIESELGLGTTIVLDFPYEDKITDEENFEEELDS